MLNIGNQKIGDIYLGGTKIKEAYLGSQLVYQKKDWVEIGGVKWAKFNIDKPGTFTKSIYDYGMMYKYNNNVGWPSSGNPSSSNPATNGKTYWDESNYGISEPPNWTSGTTPAPDGWTIPIKEEAIVLESVFCVWDAVNKGMWFADVQSDLTNPEKSLFLPAAGCRMYDFKGQHIPYYQGSLCFYWASVHQSSYGTSIYVNSGIPRVNNTLGSYAYPIRCVKI